MNEQELDKLRQIGVVLGQANLLEQYDYSCYKEHLQYPLQNIIEQTLKEFGVEIPDYCLDCYCQAAEEFVDEVYLPKGSCNCE